MKYKILRFAIIILAVLNALMGIAYLFTLNPMAILNFGLAGVLTYQLNTVDFLQKDYKEEVN